MDHVIRIEVRIWKRGKHLRHLSEGKWLPMKDADGNILNGIVGMRGVSGEKKDGTYIGGDFIKMGPGKQFPLHVHVGDHTIYFISGEGYVIINDQRIDVQGGHLIHIPGEYPHGVGVDESGSEPLIFMAVGHPHKEVDANDRMLHPRHHPHHSD